jgi:hypothetical protein
MLVQLFFAPLPRGHKYSLTPDLFVRLQNGLAPHLQAWILLTSIGGYSGVSRCTSHVKRARKESFPRRHHGSGELQLSWYQGQRLV